MDETTVCNMALGHIGADSISNLTTSRSTNAEYCNTYFETALNATLEGADWNFARVRRSLGVHNDAAPDDWSYAYQYPSDCAKLRRLLHTDRRTNDPYPFEVALQNDKALRWILTDLSPATAIYTAQITDLNLFSAQAIEAFSYKLASLIVVPITRKLEAAAPLEAMFRRKLSTAEAGSANERQRDEPPESIFVEARN